MARKKKQKVEEPEFQPSKYQRAIFDFIANNNGNLLVEAVAGSGKTTTIIEALKIIPEDKKVLFCAFNKDIVKTLTKKTKKFSNVEVRTIHGLGYKVCIDNFHEMTRKIDLNKYLFEFTEHTSKYTRNSKDKLGFKSWMQFQKNVIRLLDLSRLNLVSSVDEMIRMNERYSISIVADEYETAYKLMLWGSETTSSMDYTDMIWYPNIFNLNLDIASFDYIFVDEAQDLSKAQREFILKCNNGNTRYVFVGDSNQAIYGFSAADPNSFNELRKLDGITSLPLSVCYRCPKTVVSFVKPIVPFIEAEESASDGEISHNIDLSEINDQDMILCRYNAPLFNLYSILMEDGKKAFIMGKDIGKNLIDVIKSTKYTNLNPSLDEKGVFSALLKDYFDKRKNLMKIYGWSKELCDNDPVLVNLRDNIAALHTLTNEGKINTAAQLIDKISKIFNDNIKEGIILSTIHKAKGLEADNVYILECDYNKRACKDWEREQERNLIYVAYTRAKRKLGFINDKSLSRGVDYGIGKGYFDYIEPTIEKLYSIDYKPNPVRLNTVFHDVGKILGDEPKKTNQDSLNGLIGTKKKKINLFK